MELLKDYDCIIKYHPGKANVVANALSQKTVEIATGTIYYERENLVALRAMNATHYSLSKAHEVCVRRVL